MNCYKCVLSVPDEPKDLWAIVFRRLVKVFGYSFYKAWSTAVKAINSGVLIKFEAEDIDAAQAMVDDLESLGAIVADLEPA